MRPLAWQTPLGLEQGFGSRALEVTCPLLPLNVIVVASSASAHSERSLSQRMAGRRSLLSLSPTGSVMMPGHGSTTEAQIIHPIGVIHSPHVRAEETPIQPNFAEGVPGQAEILPEYAGGLADLDGFSHVWLLYWFHRAGPARLIVKPFLQDAEHGVFATRAPTRPNPIGLSLVRLVRREGCLLHLEDVDILDGTPLLDIKPYVPRFDYRAGARTGWLEAVDEQTAQQRGQRRLPAAGEP